MEYLKNHSYYNDRHDLHTIKQCLDYYWTIKNGFKEKRGAKDFKEYTKEEFDKQVYKVASYTVNAIKEDRYRHKADTIKEWMDRDRQVQEKYDSAQPPVDVRCIDCHSSTEVISKDLIRENDQVLFMFECLKCKKRQVLYEDGTEWHYEPELCPRCHTPLNHKIKDIDEIMTTTYSCPNCSYKKKNVDDFKKSRKEREERQFKDRKLLAEYRNEFCLNDKDGPEYIRTFDNLINLSTRFQEQKQKEKDPTYQKAMKLKKLTVVELEKLLSETLEKEKFVKLMFDKPEIDRHVIIPFTVQDADSNRKERESTYHLQKSLKKALEDTNWRLMSDGVSYRLGYLNGRLKGYEREEDLIKLVSQN